MHLIGCLRPKDGRGCKSPLQRPAASIICQIALNAAQLFRVLECESLVRTYVNHIVDNVLCASLYANIYHNVGILKFPALRKREAELLREDFTRLGIVLESDILFLALVIAENLPDGIVVN